MDEEVGQGGGGIGGGEAEECGRSEAEEEEEMGGEVYCAVGKEASKEWKANLRWVLANFPRSRTGHRLRLRLVLAHVHRPPHRINMMGAWVPVSQLAEQEVTAYRKLEEEKASKLLDDLLHVCKSQQVHARKIIVTGDDAAKGLVQLVDDHAVAELVMGAASDRAYTRKMRAPKSKKALTVQRKANPSCRIWFVCKGNLICTREVSEGLNRVDSSASSTSSRSITSDFSRSRSSPRLHGEPPFGMHEPSDVPTTSSSSLRRTPSRDDNDDATDHNIEDFSHDATVDVAGTSTVSEIVEVEEESSSAVVLPLQEIEEDSPALSYDGSDAGEMDDALYERFKEALMEAENLRHEAYEETRRRQKADGDLADASRMASEAESSHQSEARHRKEMEERLARERAAMEQDRRELDDILQQIREVNDRSAELEIHITDSERKMSELDIRMSESYGILDALRRERRREDPAAESDTVDGDQGMSFLRLGLPELEEATDHFDESVRIDGASAGGRGGVYRGSLRDMSVAVKMICPEVAVDEARFTREVEAISRARHPNLVTLVGACPEARALVHEFVPGGNLEDRLGGGGEGEGDAAPPLPWHARCGVAYRTCSALAFLHVTQPRATVHGDVRPANILLEDERCSTSKLAGLGMCRLVTLERPGDMALAYVSPQYLATGELTPECDVYALGVVLLRLVTGKPAFAARKSAQEAAAGGGGRGWQEVVDASAGAGWPTERAREVALLGLELCDVTRRPPRRRRPGELLEEARGVLEAAMSAAPGRTWSSLSDGGGGGGGGAPSYFLCPILMEVMRDPQIAGDGFSYEAEAIREWLRSGHDTSPMTNLKLPTDELVPNHALRVAIQEWRHTRPTSFDRFH